MEREVEGAIDGFIGINDAQGGTNECLSSGRRIGRMVDRADGGDKRSELEVLKSSKAVTHTDKLHCLKRAQTSEETNDKGGRLVEFHYAQWDSHIHSKSLSTIPPNPVLPFRQTPPNT